MWFTVRSIPCDDAGTAGSDSRSADARTRHWEDAVMDRPGWLWRPYDLASAGVSSARSRKAPPRRTSSRSTRDSEIMHPSLPALFLGAALLSAPHAIADATAAPAAGPSLAEPSPSPDHREIAFVSGGDIWTVPYGGGEARLLVSHPATESRPLWSPDGTRLAFVSTRTGNGDIYLLTLATGSLQRITF